MIGPTVYWSNWIEACLRWWLNHSPAKSLRNTNGFEALGSKNLTVKLWKTLSISKLSYSFICVTHTQWKQSYEIIWHDEISEAHCPFPKPWFTHMLWFKLKPRFEQDQCLCVQTIFYTKSCFTQKLCYPQTPCFTQKPCSCWACARADCTLQDSSFHGGRRNPPKAVKYRMPRYWTAQEQWARPTHSGISCNLWIVKALRPMAKLHMTYYDLSCFSWMFLIIWLESHSLFQKTRPQQHCYIKSAQACIMHNHHHHHHHHHHQRAHRPRGV